MDREYLDMNEYIAGNAVGRVFISYTIVWIINYCLVTKFNWRHAFKKTHSVMGLLAVLVVSVIGMSVFIVQGNA